MTIQNREAALRRKAKNLGLIASKGRLYVSGYNMPERGWIIQNSHTGIILAGQYGSSLYTLELEEAEAWLEEYEREVRT